MIDVALLLTRIRNSDSEAEDALLRYVEPRINRIASPALRRVHSDAARDDLRQQIRVGVLVRARTVAMRPGTDPDLFLNQLIRWSAKFKRDRRIEALDADWSDIEDAAGPARNVADASPSPEDVVAARDSADYIVGLVLRLPAAYRRVLHQRFFVEPPLTMREIAKLEGVTHQAISGREKKALEAIHSLISIDSIESQT